MRPGSRPRRAAPCPRAARARRRRRSRPSRSRSARPSSSARAPSRRRRRPCSASASATASATARVPSANRGHSKTPIGPFQKTVFASAIRVAKRSRVSGPMSSPSQPSGTSSYGDDLRLGVRLERGRRDDVRPAARPGTSSGFSSRSCSAILPPTSTASARAAEVLQHAELVLDLGAAGDRARTAARPRRAACRAPRARARAAGRRRRAAAARRPRSRRARGAPSRTRRSRTGRARSASSRANSGSFCVSPRVEARVLEHAHAVVGASSSRSRAATGAIAYAGIRPLRPPEVRADDRPPPRRARAAAAASAARRGSACRRRRGRPRAARSGRRGRARACRRRRRREPSAGACTLAVAAAASAGASPDHRDQVDEPAGVAPLVVVPAEHLGHAARSPSSAGCRRCTSTAIADDVGRDERVVGVLEDTRPSGPRGRRAEGLVDLVARRRLAAEHARRGR